MKFLRNKSNGLSKVCKIQNQKANVKEGNEKYLTYCIAIFTVVNLTYHPEENFVRLMQVEEESNSEYICNAPVLTPLHYMYCFNMIVMINLDMICI